MSPAEEINSVTAQKKTAQRNITSLIEKIKGLETLHKAALDVGAQRSKASPRRLPGVAGSTHPAKIIPFSNFISLEISPGGC